MAEVEVGDRVSMVVAGQRGDYVVSAVLETPVRGVYFDCAGPADLVALRLHPGAVVEDIRREFGGFEVRTGAAIGDAEIPGLDAARLLLILISGVVGFCRHFDRASADAFGGGCRGAAIAGVLAVIGLTLAGPAVVKRVAAVVARWAVFRRMCWHVFVRCLG
ncbi:hypothetical protein DMH04_53380 [Kibdelosporangium aridum]|uniref:Uncharacterized protein n=1 Tax=Kibdelosporangium aridum TaxID=2030 RepID=A0A428Y310_KIBAR|nr:hypothetical protein [Kibdelosporangium aridum]RSM61951.1 hypothetical protein DMH04_53380 [Kibdelosporangium aridum]